MRDVSSIVIAHGFFISLVVDKTIHHSSIIVGVGCGPAVVDVDWCQIDQVEGRETIRRRASFLDWKADTFPRSSICPWISPEITVEGVILLKDNDDVFYQRKLFAQLNHPIWILEFSTYT